jgi:peptidyl-prolyl cis-trans isomerase SurA
MKLYHGAIVFFILISSSVFGQENLIIDKIVGKVGGEIILLSDVESQFNYMADRKGGLLEPDVRCMILENILAENILVYHAKLDSIEVTDEQVEQQLDAKINSILAQMGGDEEFFKEFYGKSVNQVKDDQRGAIRKKQLAGAMQQQLISEVNITPSDVIKFFNSIPPDSIPFLNAEVELGEIVLVPQVNAEERQKALDQITDIRNQIVENGADFAEMAKKYSDDYSSARDGGNLGRQKRGTFVQEFEAAAFSMKKGELSEPIETEFGFHLIELKSRIGNSVETRHILIRPEITQKDLDLTKEKIDSIKSLVETDSMSFIQAVKKFSSKKSEFGSFHNNGKMQNPKTGTNFFNTADLPPEIYFAIESLNQGEVSEPMEYSPSFGTETYYRIVHLQSETRPHRANLKEDYSWIRARAQEFKMNEYMNSWILEKIRNTYIEIDDSYKTCPNLEVFLGKKSRT